MKTMRKAVKHVSDRLDVDPCFVFALLALACYTVAGALALHAGLARLFG